MCPRHAVLLGDGMIQDFVILCAAGMLVSVYLMGPEGARRRHPALRRPVAAPRCGGRRHGPRGAPAAPLRHRGPDHRPEALVIPGSCCA